MNKFLNVNSMRHSLITFAAVLLLHVLASQVHAIELDLGCPDIHCMLWTKSDKDRFLLVGGSSTSDIQSDLIKGVEICVFDEGNYVNTKVKGRVKSKHTNKERPVLDTTFKDGNKISKIGPCPTSSIPYSHQEGGPELISKATWESLKTISFEKFKTNVDHMAFTQGNKQPIIENSVQLFKMRELIIAQVLISFYADKKKSNHDYSRKPMAKYNYILRLDKDKFHPILEEHCTYCSDLVKVADVDNDNDPEIVLVRGGYESDSTELYELEKNQLIKHVEKWSGL